MKRFSLSAVCLLLGIAVGWYLGYTRPVTRNQRELLKQYQEAKDALHLTDADVVEFNAHLPDIWDAMKREDWSSAVIGLRGIEILNRGDAEAAKKYLAYWVGSYYRVYHNRGDTNLIERIERAAATNAVIAAEISKSLFGKW